MFSRFGKVGVFHIWVGSQFFQRLFLFSKILVERPLFAGTPLQQAAAEHPCGCLQEFCCHSHIHIHMHIYVYIYMERERERGRVSQTITSHSKPQKSAPKVSMQARDDCRSLLQYAMLSLGHACESHGNPASSIVAVCQPQL